MPCIQFTTKTKIGVVGFENLGDDQIEAFTKSGQEVRKQAKEEPLEAIMVATAITKKIERVESTGSVMFPKLDQIEKLAGLDGAETAITLQGQNVGKTITLLVVQPFTETGGKFEFKEPDIQLRVKEGKGGTISSSAVDWFLEPDKADLYRRVTLAKIEGRKKKQEYAN